MSSGCCGRPLELAALSFPAIGEGVADVFRVMVNVGDMKRWLSFPCRGPPYGVAGCDLDGKSCRVVGHNSGTAVRMPLRSMAPSKSKAESISVEDESGEDKGEEERAKAAVCFLWSESSAVAEEGDRVKSCGNRSFGISRWPGGFLFRGGGGLLLLFRALLRASLLSSSLTPERCCQASFFR